MNIRLFHRFQTPAYYYYAVHLAQGPQDMLGVLYISNSRNAPSDDNLSLALINVQKQICEGVVSYNNKGPGSNVMTDALLCYDVVQHRWVIAQLQNDLYLAMRTVTMMEDGSLRLSPLCVLDEDDSQRGFNPLLGLQITDGVYRFLYHKAVMGHMSAPLIMKLDARLGQPAWNVLEDQGEVLLSEQSFFDPGTTEASQTAALTITSQVELSEAEYALIYTDQFARLQVLCSPETWVTPQMSHPTSVQLTGEEQWRVWFTGWDSDWTTLRWTYSPDLGLPTDPSIPTWDWPPCPTVHVAVIAGPFQSPQSSPTFVAALAMLNQQQVLSHGVCLDENGQIVQICASPLGLRPRLCCCQQMMVGVDLFEGRWRLWNWPVLQLNTLQNHISLVPTCQRAYVHAEPASGRFWLIEEHQDGVRVTHRDASTLQALAPVAFLPGVSLLPDQEDFRPLDGYRDVGIVPYRETLLLLAKSADGELVLYQVQ